MTLGRWQHGVWALGLFHWLQLWMCEVPHHCQLFQPCRVLQCILTRSLLNWLAWSPMKRREGTRETWDFCCVCSMPCTRRPIRARILPRSHLDCNVKGAALFSPFASPNKSRGTLQVLKGLLWHQVRFGVPTKVFTSVFHLQCLSEKLIQPSTWQLVSRSH